MQKVGDEQTNFKDLLLVIKIIYILFVLIKSRDSGNEVIL